MVINIYITPQVVNGTLDNFVSGEHMIISQLYTNSEIRLFRNTDQAIDFIIRNIDRKPIALCDEETLIFQVFDKSKKEIINASAELVNLSRGHHQVKLSKEITGDLLLGDYTWSATAHNSETGEIRLIHTNRDYGNNAPLRVVDGPIPLREGPVAIDPTMLTNGTTSALKGSVAVNNFSGCNSFVFSLTNYTGAIQIQATINDNVPVNDQEWTNVELSELEDFTGNHHIVVKGNFTWVRANIVPDADIHIENLLEGVNEISFRNS